MSKFYGEIGYAVSTEVKPGVWKEIIQTYFYSGDVIRNNRKLVTSGNLNDNVNVSNEISIISDPFANENFHSMRYAEWMGTKWKVTDVTVQYPRLILSLGGVYNGET